MAATTCIPWEAVAAVGGVPAKMAAPQWALFYAFGLKFTLTRSPAELVLHRAIHALNLRLNARAWSRIWTEFHASDLAKLLTDAGAVTTDEVREVVSLSRKWCLMTC